MISLQLSVPQAVVLGASMRGAHMGGCMRRACLAILLALSLRRRVKRRLWVKEWYKERGKYTHLNLLREISETHAESDYKNYCRMNEQLFNELLTKITPYLTRKYTVMRDSLSVEERLALTLRFLATGRAFEDMKFSVIISQAVIETCEASQTLKCVLF
jgi:hypothetical protein